MALGFSELTGRIPAITDEQLKTNLRGQCAADNCEYQPLCMGGCRMTAFSVARRKGESEPLYAGQDICMTKLLTENV
jgi:radical SAM protein with 4Fe4S-binding SPASM domain